MDPLQRVDILALMSHVCYSGIDLWLAVALPTLSHSSWEQLIARTVHRWVWHQALWKSLSHQNKGALETQWEWCSIHLIKENRVLLGKMVNENEIRGRVGWWLIYTGWVFCLHNQRGVILFPTEEMNNKINRCHPHLCVHTSPIYISTDTVK